MMLSIYRNSYDTKGVQASFEAVVERIRDGKNGLDEKTKDSHRLAKGDKDVYRAYKAKNLPAVTFAGTFPIGKRLAAHLAKHSGQIVLDIDGLTDAQIPDLLAALSQHPNVLLAFVSPSGRGIKLVVRVDPIPLNDAEHKAAWQACVDHFQDLADEYGFEIDPSGKDCSRLCYLAHDPLAIVNIEAHLEAEAEREKRKAELESRDWGDSEKDKSALDAIHPDSLHYDDWLRIIIACKTAGLTWQEVDAWSRRGAKHVEGDIETRWDGLRTGEVNWGTVVYFAQQNGYELPQRKGRYQVDTEHQHDTSTMENERDANKKVLLKWLQDTKNKKGKHALILGSAAGTGKTTVVILTADAFLYIGQTTEEADEVFWKLWELEDDVHRHRKRMFNRFHTDFDNNPDWETLPLGLGPNERPCIQPELCDLYAQRGHPTYAVCQRCHVYADCKDDAFLSQTGVEKSKMKVVYSWDEILACDETYAHIVKRICDSDDILIMDEVNPLNLTQARQITRDMLYDLVERFRDGNTSQEFETLKALLDLISTAEDDKSFITELKAQVEAIDDIKALDDKLQQYPIGYVFSEAAADKDYAFMATMHYRGKEVTVPVVSHETAVDTPVFTVSENAQIQTDTWKVKFFNISFLIKVGLVDFNDPPRRFNKFFADIKQFLDEHPNSETAPFTFDPKAQSFDFHLKPTLNHRRVIFNTASDPDNLISEAYRDTGISMTRHTGKTPAWKPTTLTFQMATGNYLPRHSLIKRDGEKLILKPRAQEMVDRFILPTIEAGLKVLVVAPKAFQEVESVSRWAVTDLDEHIAGHNAMLINHHHAQGRNDFEHFDIAFIFHYEPNHNEMPLQATRIWRNAEPPIDFTREKRAVTVGGVTFQKNVYIDERVQAVYNLECRSRLMQSPMRLRPNIHDGKIIVFLTAEPVDIPVTPVGFSLKDGEGFTGDWQQLKTVLAGTAKRKRDAEESGDVQAVMETKGVSQRTAYSETLDARQQKDAARDARILELHNERKSQRAIEKQMKAEGYEKVSLGKVNSVITAFRNCKSVLVYTNSDLQKLNTPSDVGEPCVAGNSVSEKVDFIEAELIDGEQHSSLKSIIEYIDYRNKRGEVIDLLGSLRVDEKILSRKDAEAYESNHRLLDTIEKINSRPKLEDKDWNLLIQLELFFDVYRHAETAPIGWIGDTLIFYVPPLPMPTKPRVILMSATLVKEFFMSVFAIRQQKRNDVDFIDAADTEWHPEAKVYQLRTNKNPRATLLTGEKDEKGNWKYTGLSNTGQYYIDMIKQSMQYHADRKQGFIGHKAVLDYAELPEGVVTEHFGNLVGLDSKFKDIERLHILGSPEVGEYVIHTAAKLIYGMTDKQLDFTRRDEGSYGDVNVHKVADALVKSELTQAVGRARLVRNPAIVILWSSVELSSVTHREQTQLFDDVDFEKAQGNLDELDSTIAERDAQEAEAAEATEKGDIDGVMKATGLSERTARERTKEPRAQNKADRDYEICRRFADGQSKKQIATEMGLSQDTVKRILDKQAF